MENPKLKLAFDFLEYTGKSIFLTGKAGTGKTTFLRNFRKQSSKRMVVLAPTGVAAINAGGVTIHSFFQLPLGPYIPGVTSLEAGKKSYANKFSREKLNIIKSIDLLVIDEISMVRADLLDAINDVLCRYRERDKPFGGVQLLMIGDVQQLAPVTKDHEWELLRKHYQSPFFFSSKALSLLKYIPVELTHIYRQEDGDFITLLNNIRNKQADNHTLEELNKRYVPDFSPAENEEYITLTTHNYQAQQINTKRLGELKTESFFYQAKIEGDFPEYAYPTDSYLELKKDAQVMFIKNDSSSQKRYYNGKIGHITEINADKIWVKCKEDKEAIDVTIEEWTNTRYAIDDNTNDITETVLGLYKQLPLKAAWAITIHKSQGLTFDKAIIDAADSFSHGQVYVALSRCRSLEGLVLNSKINRNSLLSDINVDIFSCDIKNNQPKESQLGSAQKDYYLQLLKELFDFRHLLWSLQHLAKVFEEHLWKLYPELTANARHYADQCKENLFRVGERFQQQLEAMFNETDDYENNIAIHDRINKGVSYFKDKIQPVAIFVSKLRPEIENKVVKKQFANVLEKTTIHIVVKTALLKESENGFKVETYLKTRANAVIEKKPKISLKVEVSSDIKNPELYERLKNWRNEEADKLGVPVYSIIHQKALIGISNHIPRNSTELLAIPGVGKAIIKRYGTKIMEIIDQFPPASL